MRALVGSTSPWLTKIGIEPAACSRRNDHNRAAGEDRLARAIGETVGRLDRAEGLEVALEERAADADFDAQLIVEELADILARNLVQQSDRRAVALLELEAVGGQRPASRCGRENGLSGSPSVSGSPIRRSGGDAPGRGCRRHARGAPELTSQISELVSADSGGCWCCSA